MAATTVPSVIVNLKVLSKDNYKQWSFRVKTYLLAEDLWKVVDVTSKPPKEGEADFNAWSKDNAKALHTIHISCGDNAYAFIEDISVAKDAWESLAKEFNPTEASHNAGGAMNMNGNLMNGPLLEYVNAWKWDDVIEFIKIHPEAGRAIHPSTWGGTVLHHAVYAEEVAIVKELVQLMTAEDLELKDEMNNTALGSALIGKDIDKMIEIAECLVEKNQNLLTIDDSGYNIPLVGALMLQNWKMATYIYSITPLETLNDWDAAEIISLGFVFKRLDISLDLIRRTPSLGIIKDRFEQSPLFHLADTPSAFLSGSHLRCWEQWIYNCIHVEPTRTMDFKKESTININDVQTHERCQGNQRHLICSVGHFIRELVVTIIVRLLGINRLYEMKMFHVQSLEILHCICDQVLKTKDVKDMQDDDIFVSAIFRAVQLGQVEFVTHICRAIPMLHHIVDVDGRNLFQFAAECRQEMFFSLLCESGNQGYIIGMKDEFGNNTLHTIGQFSSVAQIDHIQGAALQMQRELQWFKAAESIASPDCREAFNLDYIKPFELFTKNHIKLVKKGEKSMKEIATSCTIVGALIVTIMFAATFTVPGGNNEHTVMIFLGMLISRYAQDDFLIYLPTKMIIGLSTLFISIAAMMIAFSCALFLMLHGESWIAFPAILLSTVPVASFVWMQFPLLYEIFISTYGAGVFYRTVCSCTCDLVN
ncbi:hypothetical protein M0R45_035582 [Rubus argutus]|uniref:PGG domain-containing protein n=1 Tax=Rubus argutus TaxID=59490 RepID=A0AAW1VUG2_RUBAR